MTQPVVSRVDIAPALLTLTLPGKASEIIDGTRVIITADHAYVYRDGPEGPYLFLEGPLVDFGGRSTTGYWAILEDGEHLQFRRSTGCACGSRIRSFRPFPEGLVQGRYVSD